MTEAGVSGLIGGLVIYFMLVDPRFVIITSVMSVVRLTSAAVLIFNPDVREYFRD